MAEQGGKDLLLKMGNGFTGAVTFTASSDLVTQVAHGLAVGDQVKFSAVVTTTLPAADTIYYVKTVPSADTFTLSATEGGSTLDIDADGTGTATEVFRLMGGLRSKSISISAEEIDITNHDSSQWKELLDEAGIRSVEMSGEGVFEDGFMFHKARVKLMTNKLANYQIVVNTDGDYFSGAFKITSGELSGDYNAEQSYSLSFMSSGEVTYTTV